MATSQRKPDPGTAVAVAKGLPTEAIAKFTELTERLLELQAKVNLIAPVSQVDSILPMHKVSLRAIMLDPDPVSGKDVYRDARFCKGDDVALTKTALTKIMGAAGAQHTDTWRRDDRSDPKYCELEIQLQVRDFDGTLRMVKARKEIDLRPGAPEAMKAEKVNNQKTGNMVPLDDSALLDKQRHILSLCETKAIERGLRLLFSLQHTYSAKLLVKPFLVPKLVPDLNPDDPDQKRVLMGMASGAELQLFGPANIAGGAEPSGQALLGAGEKPPLGDPGIDPPAGQEIEPRAERSEPVIGTKESAGSVDVGTLEAPPPEERAVCTCPCGHEVELTKAVAQATIRNCGAPRCAACYPWNKLFEVKRHDQLKDLGLPNRPGYSTADAVAWARDKEGAKR